MHYRYSILTGIIVLFFGVIVGTKFGIYDTVPQFDKVLHFSAGFVLAWFFMIFFKKELADTSLLNKLILLSGVVMTVGVAWEIIEYSANLITHNGSAYPLLHKYLFAGGLGDTLGDLIADFAGAVLFTIFKSK